MPVTNKRKLEAMLMVIDETPHILLPALDETNEGAVPDYGVDDFLTILGRRLDGMPHCSIEDVLPVQEDD